MEDKVLLVVAVAVMIVVLSKLKSLLAAKPKLNLPPGPWTLPVIGSIHHLVNSPSIFRAMRDLAQKHGPVMMLRLGEVPTVVVSSPEAAMAVTKTHDTTFADRFANATFSVYSYNCTDITFAPYGERWRQLRKICTLELLSAARVQSFRRIREEEVARFVQQLAAAAGAGAAVNVTKMISRFMNDAFVRESVGSRCKYQDEYLDVIDTMVRHSSGMSLADIFPSSKLVQMLDTAPGRALAAREKMQRIIAQIVQEKKEAMDRGDQAAAAGNEGFVSVLLRLQKERSTTIPLTDETIFAILFDMFAAGSETSSTALNWCMTELVRSPAAMAKAQAEVREAFKGKVTITEDDLAGLSYLKLVIKETLRLHTPLPLLLPRLCRETTQIMGYDIPKGTAVFLNVWAICRDPKCWDDAEEFKPERFKNINLDYKGTNYEYLPFGSGRRICPGINLGLANIEFALASLLYHFDWKLTDGMEIKDVDAWETNGVIGKKKTSLILHPVTFIAPANA
ncbi:hypothetical protein ACP70R_021364 [Stipagrostis hirtigluma subsp. patula]